MTKLPYSEESEKDREREALTLAREFVRAQAAESPAVEVVIVPYDISTILRENSLPSRRDFVVELLNQLVDEGSLHYAGGFKWVTISEIADIETRDKEVNSENAIPSVNTENAGRQNSGENEAGKQGEDVVGIEQDSPLAEQGLAEPTEEHFLAARRILQDIIHDERVVNMRSATLAERLRSFTGMAALNDHGLQSLLERLVSEGFLTPARGDYWELKREKIALPIVEFDPNFDQAVDLLSPEIGHQVSGSAEQGQEGANREHEQQVQVGLHVLLGALAAGETTIELRHMQAALLNARLPKKRTKSGEAQQTDYRAEAASVLADLASRGLVVSAAGDTWNIVLPEDVASEAPTEAKAEQTTQRRMALVRRWASDVLRAQSTPEEGIHATDVVVTQAAIVAVVRNSLGDRISSDKAAGLLAALEREGIVHKTIHPQLWLLSKTNPNIRVTDRRAALFNADGTLVADAVSATDSVPPPRSTAPRAAEHASASAEGTVPTVETSSVTAATASPPEQTDESRPAAAAEQLRSSVDMAKELLEHELRNRTEAAAQGYVYSSATLDREHFNEETGQYENPHYKTAVAFCGPNNLFGVAEAVGEHYDTTVPLHGVLREVQAELMNLETSAANFPERVMAVKAKLESLHRNINALGFTDKSEEEAFGVEAAVVQFGTESGRRRAAMVVAGQGDVFRLRAEGSKRLQSAHVDMRAGVKQRPHLGTDWDMQVRGGEFYNVQTNDKFIVATGEMAGLLSAEVTPQQFEVVRNFISKTLGKAKKPVDFTTDTVVQRVHEALGRASIYEHTVPQLLRAFKERNLVSGGPDAWRITPAGGERMKKATPESVIGKATALTVDGKTCAELVAEAKTAQEATRALQRFILHYAPHGSGSVAVVFASEQGSTPVHDVEVPDSRLIAPRRRPPIRLPDDVPGGGVVGGERKTAEELRLAEEEAAKLAEEREFQQKTQEVLTRVLVDLHVGALHTFTQEQFISELYLMGVRPTTEAAQNMLSELSGHGLIENVLLDQIAIQELTRNPRQSAWRIKVDELQRAAESLDVVKDRKTPLTKRALMEVVREFNKRVAPGGSRVERRRAPERPWEETLRAAEGLFIEKYEHARNKVFDEQEFLNELESKGFPADSKVIDALVDYGYLYMHRNDTRWRVDLKKLHTDLKDNRFGLPEGAPDIREPRTYEEIKEKLDANPKFVLWLLSNDRTASFQKFNARDAKQVTSVLKDSEEFRAYIGNRLDAWLVLPELRKDLGVVYADIVSLGQEGGPASKTAKPDTTLSQEIEEMLTHELIMYPELVQAMHESAQEYRKLYDRVRGKERELEARYGSWWKRADVIAQHAQEVGFWDKRRVKKNLQELGVEERIGWDENFAAARFALEPVLQKVGEGPMSNSADALKRWSAAVREVQQAAKDAAKAEQLYEELKTDMFKYELELFSRWGASRELLKRKRMLILNRASGGWYTNRSAYMKRVSPMEMVRDGQRLEDVLESTGPFSLAYVNQIHPVEGQRASRLPSGASLPSQEVRGMGLVPEGQDDTAIFTQTEQQFQDALEELRDEFNEDIRHVTKRWWREQLARQNFAKPKKAGTRLYAEIRETFDNPFIRVAYGDDAEAKKFIRDEWRAIREELVNQQVGASTAKATELDKQIQAIDTLLALADLE